MWLPTENSAVQDFVRQLWEFMRLLYEAVLESLGAVKRLSLTVSITRTCASEEVAAHESIFHFLGKFSSFAAVSPSMDYLAIGI